MNRLILLAFASFCSSAATAIADDYLLRLDTIGYVDQTVSDKNPKEGILSSIEVIARPQSKFHSKVAIGTEIVSLAGDLRPADNGSFNLTIQYLHSIDTGNFVPTENGGRKPLLDTTTIQTTVAISDREPVTIGCIDTKSSGSDKPELKSRHRCVLVLAKYKPSDD